MRKFSGAKVKQMRDHLNLSPKDFYKSLVINGLEQGSRSIDNWLSGESVPDANALAIIADTLGLPIEFFYDVKVGSSTLPLNRAPEVPSGPVRNDLPKRVSKEGGR